MRGTCDCDIGSNDTLCKHTCMSAVISSIDFNVSSDSAIKFVSANTRAVMFEVATGHKPPNSWLAPSLLNDGPNSNSQIETHCAEEIAGSDENNSKVAVLQPADRAIGSSSTLPSSDAPAALDKLGALIESVCARVTEGLYKSPEIFIPALNKCTENLAEFANTETSLVTMLYSKGKHAGCKQKQAHQHPLPGRWHWEHKNYGSSGKRKQSVGRPLGNVRKILASEQQYSGSFNAVP